MRISASIRYYCCTLFLGITVDPKLDKFLFSLNSLIDTDHYYFTVPGVGQPQMWLLLPTSIVQNTVGCYDEHIR